MYVILKKILLFFILISTSLTSICNEAQEIQQVSISNIFLKSKSSKWSQNVIANQKSLLNNKILNLKLSGTNISFVELNCYRNENKYQDYGYKILLISLNEIDLSENNSFNNEVTVLKYRCFYKGNYKKWN